MFTGLSIHEDDDDEVEDDLKDFKNEYEGFPDLEENNSNGSSIIHEEKN